MSHSTPEAELIAADHAVRTVGIPALDLWTILLQMPDLSIVLHEDNETAIIAMRQGHSAAMRHLQRTHGVALRSLAEHFRRPGMDLVYERTALQSADIYTKAFSDSADWTRALKLVNHLEPDKFWGGRPDSGGGPFPRDHKGGVQYDYWTASPWASQGAAAQQHGSNTAATAMLTTGTLQHNTVIDTHENHEYFDDTVHLYELTTKENDLALDVNDPRITAVNDQF